MPARLPADQITGGRGPVRTDLEDQIVSAKTRTLVLIFGFVAVTLGSFVWFIATWDPTLEDTVVLHQPPSIQAAA